MPAGKAGPPGAQAALRPRHPSGGGTPLNKSRTGMSSVFGVLTITFASWEIPF